MARMAQNSQPSRLQLRRVPMTRGSTQSQIEGNFLFTYITPHDSLPSDWRATSARRSSANDGYLLRQFWERVHGIRVPEDRRASEPPIGYVPPDPETVRTPSADQGIDNPNPTPSSDVSNASQSSGWHRGLLGRVLARLPPQLSANPTQYPTHVLGEGRSSSGNFSHSQPTVSRAHHRPNPLEAHGPHLYEQVRRYNATAPRMFQARIGARARWQGLSENGQWFTGLLLNVIDALWFVLKWPVCGVLLFLCAAEIIALGYTITSYAFLNTFCEMKLPFVRDQVCYNYDIVRLQRLQTPRAIDTTQDFNTIFEEKNIGNIISLPHYLSYWQSQQRYLRANLPSANLPTSDEQFFRDKLTESIDLGVDLATLAQKTFSHMYGTVSYVISGTAHVIGFLNETDFVSWIPTQPGDPRDSRLAIGMAWLDSHSLVWLPVGIEPFLERPNMPAQMGIARMKRFVDESTRRVYRDRMEVGALRDGIHNLIGFAEDLTSEATHIASKENAVKVTRGHRGWYTFLKMIGEQDLKDWTTEQRLDALDAILPVCQGQMVYLEASYTQLGETEQALNNLNDALLVEENAVKRGMSPSSWVLEQPKIMEKGAEGLRTELDVWKMRKREFNEQIFEHFG